MKKVKKAFYDGKSRSDNPYTGVNEEHRWEAWKKGYYDAAWDN